MWNIGSFSHHTPVGPQRQYSTRPIEKINIMPEYLKTGMSFTNGFGTQPISTKKKFVNPNYVNKQSPNLGNIYEKCSTFINNSNGYPNNIRKEHLSPEIIEASTSDITNMKPTNKMSATKHIKTYNKKPRVRKNWHKQSFSMELLDIDEVGIDVCNDSKYLQPDAPTFKTSPTLSEFLKDTKTSPINCIGRTVCNEILKTLSNSPICFTPVFFTISPPHALGIREEFRKRLPSDCVSEDSFILFEENSADDDSCTDDASSTDSDDSCDDCDSDDDCMNSVIENTMKTDMDCKINKSAKKVHFAAAKELQHIHPMIKWSYAYQSARKGPWELFARDRERFKNRIMHSSNVLSRILNPEHRRYIYDTRFQVQP